MRPTILVLNAGSSSVKFQLFAIADRALADRALALEFKGQVDGIGATPRLSAKTADGSVLIDQALDRETVTDVPGALEALRGWLVKQLGGELPVAHISGIASPVLVQAPDEPIHLKSSDVRVPLAHRVRSAVLLAVGVFGTAMLIGAVVSILVVVAVTLVA